MGLHFQLGLLLFLSLLLGHLCLFCLPFLCGGNGGDPADGCLKPGGKRGLFLISGNQRKLVNGIVYKGFRIFLLIFKVLYGFQGQKESVLFSCLLYTSDAADE